MNQKDRLKVDAWVKLQQVLVGVSDSSREGAARMGRGAWQVVSWCLGALWCLGCFWCLGWLRGSYGGRKYGLAELKVLTFMHRNKPSTMGAWASEYLLATGS